MVRQSNHPYSDERAVSPVIGVILMVAITVILAAVVGTFVLGLGQNFSDTTPQVSLSIEDASGAYENGAAAIELEHTGGDAIALDETRIVVRNSSNQVVAEYRGGAWVTPSSGLVLERNGATASSTATVSTGDVLEVVDNSTVSGTVFSSGETYQVVVIDSGSERQIASARVRVT